MANVKRVKIVARVPFDWPFDAPADDAAYLGKMFVSPTIGLRLSYQADGTDGPNEHGGYTTMYLATIEGEEAISFDAVERMTAILASAGSVLEAWAQDIEDLPSSPVYFSESLDNA